MIARAVTARRFVIILPPRSGGGYVASVLRQCGINCGHEEVFTAGGFIGWNGYEGDASWFAIGYIADLAQAVRDGAYVIHQVRNPLHTVRSMLSSAVVARRSEFAAFRHVDDPVLAACYAVDWWHKECENQHPDLTRCVERDDVEDILELLQIDVDREARDRAIEAAYRNERPRHFDYLDWEHLTEDVRVLAKEFGYL